MLLELVGGVRGEVGRGEVGRGEQPLLLEVVGGRRGEHVGWVGVALRVGQVALLVGWVSLLVEFEASLPPGW